MVEQIIRLQKYLRFHSFPEGSDGAGIAGVKLVDIWSANAVARNKCRPLILASAVGGIPVQVGVRQDILLVPRGEVYEQGEHIVVHKVTPDRVIRLDSWLKDGADGQRMRTVYVAVAP